MSVHCSPISLLATKKLSYLVYCWGLGEANERLLLLSLKGGRHTLRQPPFSSSSPNPTPPVQPNLYLRQICIAGVKQGLGLGREKTMRGKFGFPSTILQSLWKMSERARHNCAITTGKHASTARRRKSAPLDSATTREKEEKKKRQKKRTETTTKHNQR